MSRLAGVVSYPPRILFARLWQAFLTSKPPCGGLGCTLRQLLADAGTAVQAFVPAGSLGWLHGVRLDALGGGAGRQHQTDGRCQHKSFHGWYPFLVIVPPEPRQLGCGHGRLAKGLQERRMTFIEQSQVANTILQHGEAFNPRAKSKARMGGNIDAAHRQDRFGDHRF